MEASVCILSPLFFSPGFATSSTSSSDLLWLRIIPWKSNSPSSTTPPKHKNGTLKIRPWDLKKNKKPIEIRCFIRFHEHVSFGGENCTENDVSQRPCLSCISCRSALFFGGFLGSAQMKYFLADPPEGKYFLGSIYRVYQIHKSHCCSMGLVSLCT